MNRLWERMRIIPTTALVVAAILYLTLAATMWLGPISHEREVQEWPMVLKLVLTFVAPLIVSIYVLLVGFVYADARRRAMRHTMWTLIAIFVPYGIGMIFYFAMRDPLPAPCPQCNVTVPASFTFCPHCGFAIRPTCSQCGKQVENSWANCAHCGTKLPKDVPQTAA
ncbi:MAG: zinc ribbon domain-containing protein [Acidobacteria bacterium]|nr:zinc ribbon domain-containing protein [Acidobacteriota bacterium]